MADGTDQVDDSPTLYDQYKWLEGEYKEQQEQIATLEKQLAEKVAADKASNESVKLLLKREATLRAQLKEFENMSEYSNVIRHYQIRLEEIEAPLKKHGGHTADCPRHEYNLAYNEPEIQDSIECIKSCGWADISEGLK